MSGWDDLEDVTPRISNEDAERLLSGTCGIDEARELGDLAGVFRALRGPTEPAELSGLDSVLSAFGAAAVAGQSDLLAAGTRPMIKKRLTGKAVAAVAVVTLVSAGAAAAAGVVPTPFVAPTPIVSTSTEAGNDDSTDQTDADEILDTTIVTTPTTLGTTTPDPNRAAAPQPITDDTDAPDARGPDVNGPAKFGLCTAFDARTKHTDPTPTDTVATPTAEPAADEGDLPVPFQALQDAADAAGQTVAEFCADAVPGGASEPPGKSGDNPSATAPGHADDNPSATAPGHADDNPSATAPGHADDNPSATAPGHAEDNPGAGHGQTPPSHP